MERPGATAVSNKRGGQSISSILISMGALFMTSIYPCLFIYFQNIGEASFLEVGRVCLFFAAVAAIAFLCVLLCVRKLQESVTIASIIMLLVLNFAFLENLIKGVFPSLLYWHTFLIIAYIALYVFYFLHKKLKPRHFRTINVIVLAVFFGLTLLNGAMALPDLSRRGGGPTQSERTEIVSDPTATQEQPNVYFFLFDEFGGADNVLRYCDYDATPFYKALERLSFNTDPHANSGSIETTIVIPNLLQLETVNGEDTSHEQRMENAKDPYLLRLAKANGYKINCVQSKDHLVFIDEEYADAVYVSDYTSVEWSATYYILQNTVFYPFYKNDRTAAHQDVYRMFDYAKSTISPQGNSTFTIGYFFQPHNPFIFDEFGNPAEPASHSGMSDGSAYLGQYKFICNQMLSLAGEIVRKDPNSIIILQSDHGFRLPNHQEAVGILDGWDESERSYMSNILSALYFQGERIDITGLSGLEVLQYVFEERLFAR